MMFFLIAILSFNLSASVKRDTVSSRLHDYSYEEFCKTMNAKNNMLISFVNASEMECFNQKFKIRDFCLKKMPVNANFTRGFGVESEKKIYCEEALNVSVSIDCNDMKKSCSRAKQVCEDLKSTYAYSLELGHSSVTDGKLNCYYTKEVKEEDLNEI